MCPTFSSCLVVGCTLLAAACDLAPSRPPFADTFVCYASPDGWSARSTLWMQPGTAGERLLGTTELSSGARLIERAELDVRGRLVTGEAQLEQGPGQPPVQIEFDRARGTVVVDSSLSHFVWTVPTDELWAWAPLLSAAGTGKPVTTPLLGRVVLGAVRDGSPLRMLDLGSLRSSTLTADQVVSYDEGEALAVVLDDTVQFKAGVPEHLQLSALSTSLDRVGNDTSSNLLWSSSRTCGGSAL
jgi:hypothetical protein